MRRFFPLFVLIALLWGGLHVADGPLPHDPHRMHQQTVADNDTGEARDTAGKAGQATHHHCPLAADACVFSDDDRLAPIAPVILAAPAMPLRAFSRAPPVPPPSA